MNKLCYFGVCLLIANASSLCKRCFPPGFLWGTATSSYQIEGAWNASGKGENIWDWFTHTYPEKIADGSNGDVATDSYNRYEEDIALLENLGVNFYRFSLSWSRILPDGTVNNINADGVNYYLNVLKKLKEKNIEPVVTIHHWDLPMTLHLLGGWTNAEIADYFAEYARLCYTLFGEYVKYWLTLNEPLMNCQNGYGTGSFAPGYTESGTLTYACFYTHLLGHAKAYRYYNESFRAVQNGQVGINLVSNWFEPLSDSEEDKIAAENALQWDMGMTAHPVLIGNWPPVVSNRIANLSTIQGFNESRLPSLSDEEVALIKGTYDYVGLNYYATMYATPIANISELEKTTVSYIVDKNVATSYDETWPLSGWVSDVPFGLRKLLNWVSNNYDHPRILITENGQLDDKTTLNDTKRISYIQGHLCSLLRAKLVDGIDVFGYAHWTLINNFEWDSGYMVGFGLVDVDFSSSNLTRTPKASYYYYKTIAESNCLEHCSFK